MILVTGGAGYIGSHTNKELYKAGYDTLVYDNLVYGHRQSVKWGNFILGDLNNKEQLALLFSKYSIEAVMHFAAYAYVGESVIDPSKYFHNNIVNTLHLLEVMHRYNVNKIVFSSTCATYGEAAMIPITEQCPQNPINPYGFSKLAVEKILEAYDQAYGFRYVSLRYFNAAGADYEGELGEDHTPETHLIPLTLDAAIGARDSIAIFGTDYNTKDGSCIRDYIHVTDLADAHVKALQYLFNKGRSVSLNLGTNEGVSVKEIIENAAIITGKNIKIKELPRRQGDPKILIGSHVLAKEVLNWNPVFSDIKNIIATAWKWKLNPKW